QRGVRVRAPGGLPRRARRPADLSLPPLARPPHTAGAADRRRRRHPPDAQGLAARGGPARRAALAGSAGVSGLEVAWLGHATTDIRLGGGRFVTAPLLRD